MRRLQQQARQLEQAARLAEQADRSRRLDLFRSRGRLLVLAAALEQLACVDLDREVFHELVGARLECRRAFDEAQRFRPKGWQEIDAWVARQRAR